MLVMFYADSAGLSTPVLQVELFPMSKWIFTLFELVARRPNQTVRDFKKFP